MRSGKSSMKSYTAEKADVVGSSEPSNYFDHKLDADEALSAVSGHPADFKLDEATNKRLLRKIDLILLPVSISHGLLQNASISESNTNC